MDSWEFNKIAAAVLSALLVAFGSGTLIEVLSHSKPPAQAGYALALAAPSPAPSAAAPAGGSFSFAKVAGLLPQASTDNGQAVFKRCTTCHTPEKGGRSTTGPNLWGIIGRTVAAHDGYKDYSAAMKAKGGNWSYEGLAAYLYDPKAAIPGNKMVFAGIKGDKDLADLIAYLRSLADTPAPLPNTQG